MNALTISLMAISLLLLLVPTGIGIFTNINISTPIVYGLAAVGIIGLIVSNIFAKKDSECTVCPAGPRGDKGATGARGPTGAQGIQGKQGAKGTTGDIGPRGEKGATGAQGIQGEKGGKGEKGEKGDTGNVGPRGSAGATGNIGPRGEKGATGKTGAKGDKGDKGDKGSKGDTGSAGPRGAKGATGDVGPRGAKGATGDVGPQGPIGDCSNCKPIPFFEIIQASPSVFVLSYSVGGNTPLFLIRGTDYSSYNNSNYYLNLRGLDHVPQGWISAKLRNDGNGKISVIDVEDVWTSFMVFVVGENKTTCGLCSEDILNSGGGWPSSCLTLNDTHSGYNTNLAMNITLYNYQGYGIGVRACDNWIIMDMSGKLIVADRSATVDQIFSWDIHYES